MRCTTPAACSRASAFTTAAFKLREHTLRLADSARKLGFELPYDIATLEQACKQVVAANGIGDGYVRPLAWRGRR